MPTPQSRSTRNGEARRTPSHPTEIGQVFAGRYRLDQLIGEGGMGRVYRAHDLVLDETIALKVLPQRRNRFFEPLLNEVRQARQVTHSCVCRVFDFGQADGETYLTMEFVDGEDLSALLRKVGRLTDKKVLDLAVQLCAGLDAVHEQGIVHQDLKPANLLIDRRGRLQITDFGIAGPADHPRRVRAGTPAYMAPELLSGHSPDVQSDIYSLGIVLFEAATGRPLFKGGTTDLVDTERDPEKLCVEALSQVEPALRDVILGCLQPCRERRPKSVREVAGGLPGIDPIRRALDAGETPSPEAVADATSHHHIQLSTLTALGTALVLVLALLPLWGDQAFPGRSIWNEKSPEVLVNRAGEILTELGHEAEEGSDAAWGFRPDFGVTGDPDANLFWYRSSPYPMVPSDHFSVSDQDQVTYYDPPPMELGMVQMLLDSKGRLVTYKLVSSSVDLAEVEETTDITPAPWNLLLSAGGFTPDRTESAEPTLLPAFYADERRAWTAAYPDEPERRMRIEAAALDGKVVFFDARPLEPPELPGQDWAEFFGHVFTVLFLLLSFVLPVAGVILARRHFLEGRGDRVGAQRLFVFVLVAELCRWVLAADHVGSLSIEVSRIHFHLGRILLEALLVWAAYMAFEPLVRRFWHEPIVSWSRLLRGRVKDPLVGRSLLIGSLAGACWALLGSVDRVLGNRLGLDPTPEITVPGQLENVLSARRFMAGGIDMMMDAVYYGIFDICLLVLLRLSLRRPLPALLVFALINGLWATMDGWNPVLSWFTLGVGVAGTGAFLLVRFGLLAYLTGFFVQSLLSGTPVTLATGAWFASSGAAALAVVFLLGAFGFQQALGGRSLTARWLDSADPPTTHSG